MNNLTIKQQLTLEALNDTVSLKTILHRFRRAGIKFEYSGYTDDDGTKYCNYDYNQPQLFVELVLPSITEDGQDNQPNYRLSVRRRNPSRQAKVAVIDTHLKITQAIKYCQAVLGQEEMA